MRVLIAEDDAVSRHVLGSFLAKWGYDVVALSDGAAALRMLELDDPPLLVILDWMMPGVDGVEICRRVRNQREEPYLYVILLTTKDRKRDIIEGLDAGADDYITKPFNANELRARLRAGCRIIELQEQLVVARETLRAEATHDPLTGLWNRAAVLEVLHRALARVARQGSPLTVILADLDHFKRINDTHGHLAGDAVLREAVRRMSASIRPYDSIGRYGGEEFLIVAPGCDAANTVKFAERLRTRVSRETIDIFEGSFPVTVSLGAAATRDRRPAEALLRDADAALYRAKDGGRNRVELAV